MIRRQRHRWLGKQKRNKIIDIETVYRTKEQPYDRHKIDIETAKQANKQQTDSKTNKQQRHSGARKGGHKKDIHITDGKASKGAVIR